MSMIKIVLIDNDGNIKHEQEVLLELAVEAGAIRKDGIVYNYSGCNQKGQVLQFTEAGNILEL